MNYWLIVDTISDRVVDKTKSVTEPIPVSEFQIACPVGEDTYNSTKIGDYF